MKEKEEDSQKGYGKGLVEVEKALEACVKAREVLKMAKEAYEKISGA